MELADLIVMEPGGVAYLLRCAKDESPNRAARRVIGDVAGTQGMGRLRAYFADDFGAQPTNPTADRVLQGIGYHHPFGWHGPVLLSMEEDEEGRIRPLAPEIIEAVADLVGAPLQVRH